MMRRLAFAGFVAASAAMAARTLAQAPAKRALQVADLYRLRTVGDPQRSPDGALVAYTVAHVDTAKDRAVTEIWWTSWDGTTSTRVTTGEESASQPRWSPDGRQLAFLSSRQGAKESQIWLINRGGGEAERISDMKGGVSSLAWAPDGRRLALVVGDPEPAADSANARPKPIVLDKYHFKEDGKGFIGTLRSHVYVFDLATRKAEQITKGDADDAAPAWSPDGRWIAFTSQREPDAERYDNGDVYVVEARAGAEPKRLTTFQGNDEGPLSWSPDGSLISYRQGPEPKHFGYGGGFGTVAVVSPGGGPPRLLATSLDRVVSGSRWSHDGRSIVGTVVDDQRQYLVRIRVDGSGVDRLAAPVPVIGAFSEGADGGIAALGTSPSEPAELFAVEPNGGTRQLTHHNAWLGTEVALATVEPVVSKSADGTEVHGILRRPAGAAAGRKQPMIVRVHGGPAGQDAFQFDFEKELLAARGWAVLAPNYRGSSGRGAAYTIAIAGDWCNKEVSDIHGMVDALVKSGVADDQHLGVGGWSYGGILTDCLVASDTRFKAATSGAGVSDVFAMYGHDQYVVQYDLELGQPWKNVDKWMKVSTAFFHADRIKTPTLFLGGALDANVPVLGGEQMYEALKSLGIETELIVYPGEYHGIRRPSFQRDRLERYLAWYSKYLMTAQ